MKAEYAALYEQMQQAIQNCLENDPCKKGAIECCFHAAQIYWIKLRELITSREFCNLEDEIDFFKNVKPLFTSEIEYYNLIYMARLFEPEDPKARKIFWQRELQRFERFKNDNVEFYLYYINGNTFMDHQYFLRDNSDLSNFQNPLAYELDNETSTSHDYLIVKILALKKYSEYIRKELDSRKDQGNS